MSFCKLPITTAPRPGGSFGALAADFSKSCDCRTSDLRLLGSPSAGASVAVALRKDYIADGVFTFFVHWPCLRFLLIFATNFQLIFGFPDFVFLIFFLFSLNFSLIFFDFLFRAVDPGRSGPLAPTGPGAQNRYFSKGF